MIKSFVSIFAGLLLLGSVSPQEDLGAIEKDFKLALQMQAEKPLESAVRSLMKVNTGPAVKIVLEGLKLKVDVSVYWILVRGAAAFASREALAEVADYIIKNTTTAVARDLVSALHGNFTEGCETALITLLANGSSEVQVIAVEHMMDVGGKETVTAVLAMLAKPGLNPELNRRLFRVLSTITIADYGETLSNWAGWWEANKEKPWADLKAKPAGSAGTGTVADNVKKTEYEKLKTGKILVLGAGDKCKCKKNHDLDNIDQIVKRMGLPVEKVDKIEFCKPTFKVDDYIAILCNCTFIEKHCVCPTCKPGDKSDLRRVT